LDYFFGRVEIFCLWSRSQVCTLQESCQSCETMKRDVMSHCITWLTSPKSNVQTLVMNLLLVELHHNWLKKWLNQQNKEFASKQNFNNLMIKIYFLHTYFEPTLWVVTSFPFFMHKWNMVNRPIGACVLFKLFYKVKSQHYPCS
jgi:hypothetical protein